MWYKSWISQTVTSQGAVWAAVKRSVWHVILEQQLLASPEKINNCKNYYTESWGISRQCRFECV